MHVQRELVLLHLMTIMGRERFIIEGSKKIGNAILYGTITIFIFVFFSSIVFAFILRFTSMQESSLQYIMTALSFFALFTGGFIAGRKGKQKGWLLGGLTGFIYSLIIFLYQFLGLDSLFNLEQVIYYVCYILISMMGGILGVNLSGKSRTA